MDELDIEGDLALSDDEETVTAQQVLERLERAWMNEKFSPELLPHQGDIVQCIAEQISGMETNLEQLKPGDLRGDIHRLELDRIRYVLCSYLRLRIEKIEEFAGHILEQEEGRSQEEQYLTPDERSFAEDYQNNVEGHFRALVLRHVCTNLQEVDRKKVTVIPNINTHVFIKAVETTPGVMLEAGDSDDVVDLVENSQHIMLYSAVQGLVKSGAINLI